MPKEIKFSIIIPYCYKYDVYFKECFESVISQTYKNFEIILVAYKEEIQYLDLYKNYENVFIEPSEYKDQSHNRNIGIKKAQNDYIVFVDCDDLIAKDYLSFSKQIIEENDPDLIIYNYTINNELLGKNNNIYYFNNKSDFVNATIYSQYSKSIKATCNLNIDSIWAKVFKKKIIENNSVFYNESCVCAEDALFVRDYSLYINSIAISENYMSYFWRQNPISTMHTIGGFYDLNIFAKHLQKTLNKLPTQYHDNFYEYIQKIFLSRIDALISFMYFGTLSAQKLCQFLTKTYPLDSYTISVIKNASRSRFYVECLKKNRKFSLQMYFICRNVYKKTIGKLKRH